MRKPRGMPTTFGKQESFLDYLLHPTMYQKNNDADSLSLPAFLVPYINFNDGQMLQLTPQIIQSQQKIFGDEGELWLLNRLDNETGGFLYFAKEQQIYDKYRQQQTDLKIQKFYIAQVDWIFTNPESLVIDSSIMHHKYQEDQMICIKSDKDIQKWRGKCHQARTEIKVMSVDTLDKTSTLLITIYKWIRHQIRVHLVSIWYPVLGDSLYGKLNQDKKLHLRSIWFQGYKN